jgi:hypothetical protein
MWERTAKFPKDFKDSLSLKERRRILAAEAMVVEIGKLLGGWMGKARGDEGLR